ncbi:protein tyrosine phosphatase [Rhodovarius crocodyli]|uniref:Protein tyrosine phosphatase n=1 Tax=Rhodovarius crocodyli TaxID=1979269 RepID=A0A437MDI5_9PROT|nr:tyrosine-protein phosphatase [Rhodovarius crocodyli]RVT95705.1 protein tyrosine phosphatase [Rhodovarius crocodyli]
MRRWLNALFVDHAVFRLVWRNWGVVEPGRLYRSNHPLPWQIRRAIRVHGIRTIVNLRGHRQDCGADALSRAEAARLGITLIDAPFESRGAPHVDRIERFAAMLPDLQEPILIHCKSGADRTGLIAAVWLLLNGRPPAEAQRQLSLRYGHFAAARTGILDAFVALYARAWPKPFMQWLREDYDAAKLRQDFRSRKWADAITDGLLRRE